MKYLLLLLVLVSCAPMTVREKRREDYVKCVSRFFGEGMNATEADMICKNVTNKQGQIMKQYQMKFYTEMSMFNKIHYNKEYAYYTKLYQLYVKQIDKQALSIDQELQLHTLLDTQRLKLSNMLRNMQHSGCIYNHITLNSMYLNGY